MKSKIGLRMSDALLIVDLQRDFCAGGKLEIPGAEDILPRVNALVEEARSAGALVVASRDLHPPDHMSWLSAAPGRSIACAARPARSCTRACA